MISCQFFFSDLDFLFLSRSNVSVLNFLGLSDTRSFNEGRRFARFVLFSSFCKLILADWKRSIDPICNWKNVPTTPPGASAKPDEENLSSVFINGGKGTKAADDVYGPGPWKDSNHLSMTPPTNE